MNYLEVQNIAKQTIDYIKTVIKPNMMDWTTYFSAVIDLSTLLLGVLGILITFILRDTDHFYPA